MQLVLTFEDPERRRRRGVVLRERIVLGRVSGPDRVVVDDPAVAEPHAEIACGEDGTVRVRAQSPDAALFHNGRLVEAAVLSPGDTLQFGATAARIVHERDQSWSEVVPLEVLRSPRRRTREGRIAARATGAVVAAGFLALLATSMRPGSSAPGRAARAPLEPRPVVASSSPTLPARALARNGSSPAPARLPDFSGALDAVVGLTRAAPGRPGMIGSGFIATTDGLVVTNARLVAGASEVETVFRDGSRLAGRVAAEDRSRDIALVQLPRGNAYRPLAIARTHGLRIGAPVWVIGFPGPKAPGFKVTGGTLNGVRRVPGLVVLVLHDALTDAGGAGGLLFDESARIVGINTSEVATGDRIGFAVAGDEILDLLEAHR